MNALSLFAIGPGLVVQWLSPKKSAVLGGLLIMFAQLMTVFMVKSERESITKNSYALLFAIIICAGQGSCMVLLSVMQALLNMQTIQSTSVISTCIFSYYLGSDSFLAAVKRGLWPEMSFEQYTTGLGIFALFSAVANGVCISDKEDSEGFFGKAAALTQGLIYKATNKLNLAILVVYTLVLIVNLELYN